MVFALACFMSTGIAFAEGEKPAAEQPAAKPAMDPAQMEKMKTLMAPGEAHKIFESLAGKWTYTSKMWMPGADKPEESAGTSENTVVYGGRFLKEDVKGTWMAQPFEGTGYVGYDNVREEYQSTWMDSMVTGIMWSSGKYDTATKTLSMSGTNSCPMTGKKNVPGRTEWKVVDATHNTFSMYSAGPDGKEMKMMEIEYQKAA